MTSTILPTAAIPRENAVKITIINPTDLYDPVPLGYSHAVLAEGGARTVYLAGQGGQDKTGALSPQFSDQVKQAFDNIKVILKTVDAEPCQITKITTYIVNYEQSMHEVVTRYIKEAFGYYLPAQTLVPVPRLALDGMLFEVDAIAVLN